MFYKNLVAHFAFLENRGETLLELPLKYDCLRKNGGSSLFGTTKVIKQLMYYSTSIFL